MLLWVIGARREIERWEYLAAQVLREDLDKIGTIDGPRYWLSHLNHHLAVVATHHAIEAAKLDPDFHARMDAADSRLIRDVRDLHEHWVENKPIFFGRIGQPAFPSGRHFRELEPVRPPYAPMSWANKTGLKIAGDVTVHRVHVFLDSAELYVLERHPEFAGFVPNRRPSPWMYVEDFGGEWWPRPAAWFAENC